MFSEIFEGLSKKKKYHDLKKKNQYTVETENLAVPEIHVEHGSKAADAEKEEITQPEETETTDDSITYDNVAIPEIHVHHSKKEQ